MNRTAAMHTPGPWNTWENGDAEIGIEDSECMSIATMDGNSSQDKHNARLIAAAPDLLAACEITASIPDTDALSEILRAVSAARTALAKATGEGMP